MTREGYGKAYESGVGQTVVILLSKGANLDDAADIAQNAWMRGWERLHQLHNDGLLCAWINRIAVNLLFDKCRGKHQPQQLDLLHESVIASEFDLTGLYVEDVYRLCNPRDGQLFRAVYVEGHSASDVARALGVSVGRIHARVSRARRAIRKRMGVAPEVDVAVRKKTG